jgi:hypothetical protein
MRKAKPVPEPTPCPEHGGLTLPACKDAHKTEPARLSLDEELRVAACALPESSTHRDLLLRASAALSPGSTANWQARRAVLLLGKLQVDFATTKEKLKDDLSYMKVCIERALRDLEAGEGLDEHLVQNMMGVTHGIVHYNVARDLLPYLEAEETK